MRQGNSSPLRVLHLVSSRGVVGAVQQSLFMPLLIKAPKQHVAAEVICLAPGEVPAAVLRQNGIPVHEVPLSSQRFSLTAFSQLIAVAREFAPEVIHAWGYTAHVLAGWLRKRCNAQRVLFSATGTMPVVPQASFLARQKVKAAARAASKADRVVYSSEAAAAAHRRCGFPEQEHAIIAPGVDPNRFKADPAVRRRIREQLQVPANAFVVGMMAPCQVEYDHATFLKGIGDLVKTQPNIYLLLAGHGVQKGNASLMAQLNGNLATRTQLLGESSDQAGFFNACDVVVSSALTDAARMYLVMAMMCAVPCVATGVGEQGEVIGQCSVVIEPSSPAAIVRGISRVIEMPAERRTFLAQSSRKHALKNFAQIRALHRYVQLYSELLGRGGTVEELIPAAVEPAAPVVASIAPVVAPAVSAARLEEPAPRDSIRAKEVIDWQPPVVPTAKPAPTESIEDAPVSDGDVLAIFESALESLGKEMVATPAAARQRADETEDLLAPELLAANAGGEFRPRQATVGKGKTMASAASSESATVPVRQLRAAPGATSISSGARSVGIHKKTNGEPGGAQQRIAQQDSDAEADNSDQLAETLRVEALDVELLAGLSRKPH